jgi:hypothetical protein
MSNSSEQQLSLGLPALTPPLPPRPILLEQQTKVSNSVSRAQRWPWHCFCTSRPSRGNRQLDAATDLYTNDQHFETVCIKTTIDLATSQRPAVDGSAAVMSQVTVNVPMSLRFAANILREV